jgi:hypothetical protein
MIVPGHARSGSLVTFILVSICVVSIGCLVNHNSAPPGPSQIIDIVPTGEPVATAISPSPSVTPASLPTLSASGPLSAGLIREFINASFRVIAVAKNPFAPYSLIVATERSNGICGTPEQPVRCRIDDTCGSTETSPICYFFIEPGYEAAADPSTRFIARWPDDPREYSLDPGSIRFVDGRTVEFIARSREGGQDDELWWLDLVTGAVAQLDRNEP